MRCNSVIGATFNHLLAVCCFFILGFLIGLLPLGLPLSMLLEWLSVGGDSKDVAGLGGMMGAGCLSIAYVAICLHGRFCRQDGLDWTERQIKYLFGWSFFTFLGFVLGCVVLWVFLPNQGYCLMGGLCFSIGYVAYWYSVENSRNDTELQYEAAELAATQDHKSLNK